MRLEGRRWETGTGYEVTVVWMEWGVTMLEMVGGPGKASLALPVL